jgi:hypothetical protein
VGTIAGDGSVETPMLENIISGFMMCALKNDVVLLLGIVPFASPSVVPAVVTELLSAAAVAISGAVSAVFETLLTVTGLFTPKEGANGDNPFGVTAQAVTKT